MHTSHDYNSLFNRTAFRSVSIGYVTSHVKDRNKKVLLRERKRHTGRRVASAHYAALPNGWGRGVPHPVLAVVLGYLSPPSRPGQGGTPTIQTWLAGGGTPNTPPPSRPGRAQVPPTIQTWDGVSPHPDQGWGTPHSQTCDGVPLPPTDLGQGNSHPPQVWTDWKY